MLLAALFRQNDKELATRPIAADINGKARAATNFQPTARDHDSIMARRQENVSQTAPFSSGEASGDKIFFLSSGLT